jgi:hypothetical protein
MPAPTDAVIDKPARTSTGGESADLSAEIALTIERQPGDVVKCTRIYGDHYRCNWWAVDNTERHDNPALPGAFFTTHHIRQSWFIHATKPAGNLAVRVKSAPPSVR